MVESRNFLKSNKGQGTIEYILLLVITITMILLALGQIFKPLGTFMQDYMGTYVACMLSSGELPGLKGEDKLQDANPTCSVKFNGGKGSTGGNGANGNGQNGSDPNGQNGANSNAKNANNGNGKNGSNANRNGSSSDGSGSGGSSSGNTYAGSSSRRSMFGRGRTGSSDAGDADAGGKKTYVNALNGKGDKFFRQKNQPRSVYSGNGRGIAISGFTEEMKRKQERKIQSEARVLPKSEAEEFSKPQKKSIVKPPTEIKKSSELKTEEMSFGGYFKYILIAVIILLIVILGGGQMFEMSKSYD